LKRESLGKGGDKDERIGVQSADTIVTHLFWVSALHIRSSHIFLRSLQQEVF
jgi:hypothetical protein